MVKQQNASIIPEHSVGVRTKDLLVGMGLGTRIFLLYFPLKFDVAWSYNGIISKPKYYISLGGDF